MSETKEYIRVLYNGCYGGFMLSNEAVNEYQARTGLKIRRDFSRFDIEPRTDPVLLAIYDLIGSARFSGKYSKILYKQIEAQYLDYIQITEYDGVESVGIRKHEYLVCTILKSETLSDAEKVQELKKLYFTNGKKKTFITDDELDNADYSD
jgi:hypothetical protein